MSDGTEDLDLGGDAAAPAEGDGGLPPAGQTPDVFADVPADGGVAEAPPGGGLGGDGATLEELEQEPAVEEAPLNGEAAEADPLAPEPGEEPVAPAEEPPAEPEPEPAPDPEPKAAAKKSGGGKKGTTERIYHVLQQGEDGSWVTPESLKDGLKAANGEAAMRAAYAELVDEDKDDPVTLAVIPAHYWNPRTVQSKVRRDRAIEIV